ncbi:MAG: hypothetical protein ACKV2O_00660 [Acidimicrobiales bacterium]
MNRVRRMVALGAIAAGAALSVGGPAGAVVVGGNVTPQGGTFTDGQVITVAGSAGTVSPSAQLIVSLCRNTNIGVSFDPQADCDFTNSQVFVDPAFSDGSFGDSFAMTDPADFDCTVAAPCRLRVNVGTFFDPSDQAFIPGFVISGPVVTTTTTTTAPTTTAPTTSTTAPDPIIPEAPLNVLIPLGGAAALGGAYFLLRRGRTA